MRNTVLFFHLLGMALALGGAIAALVLEAQARAAKGPDASLALRKSLLAVTRKTVLLGLFAAVGAGIVLVVQAPELLKQHWMHPKLLCAFIALVTVHVDVIISKKLLAAEESGDTGVHVASVQARARKAAIARRVTALAILAALYLGATKPF